MVPGHDIDDVAVSIVTMGNAALLERALSTLPGSCEGLRWRATIVDNGASPIPRDVVLAVPNARLVRSDAPRGFGANHNLVLGAVVAERSARYVLVLNDDTELEAGSVSKLVALCDADVDLGLAGPSLLYPDGGHQASGFRFPTVRSEAFSAAILPERVRAQLWPRLVEVVPGDDGPTGVDWVLGAALLARVSSLAETGCFDERFFLYSEELDLARRMRSRGYRAAVLGAVRVLHVGGQSTGAQFPRTAGISRWLYLQKHWSRARRCALVGVLTIVYVWNTAYVLIRIAAAPTSARPKARLWLAHWRARPLPPRTRARVR